MQCKESTMHLVAFLVSALLVSAALAQDLLAEAQIQVRNRLRDPESAQFDNLRAAQKTVSEKKVQVVCGNVNARNSTGQLSGPSPFVFLGEMRESWLARNHDILKELPRIRNPGRKCISNIARNGSNIVRTGQRGHRMKR